MRSLIAVPAWDTAQHEHADQGQAQVIMMVAVAHNVYVAAKALSDRESAFVRQVEAPAHGGGLSADRRVG